MSFVLENKFIPCKFFFFFLAVVKLEGGTDEDVKALDLPPVESKLESENKENEGN